MAWHTRGVEAATTPARFSLHIVNVGGKREVGIGGGGR